MISTRLANAVAPAVAAIALAAIGSTMALPTRAGSDRGGPVAADGRTDLKDMKREWSQATRALVSFGASQRDRALGQGRDVLEAIDQRIEQLENRAASEWSRLGEAAREQRRKALRDLRQRRNEAAQWYGGMKQSSDGAWDEVQKGFIDAYGALARSFDKAAGEFDGSS